MIEHYHKWYSQFFNRDFEMLVFGETGIPLILFPSTRGRYYTPKDYGFIHSVQDLVNSNKLKIYCPDSIINETWLNYSISPEERVTNHLAYENTILKDVIEFAKYETGYNNVILAGFEFGAYYSLNISFKYPELVEGFYSFCGIYDMKQFIMGYYDDDCYYNSPLDYIPNLKDPKYLNQIKEMPITIVTGNYDNHFDESTKISQILNKKKIGHTYAYLEGLGKNWDKAREAFKFYISNYNF